MEAMVYTFENTSSSNSATFMIALSAAVLGLLGCIFLLWRSDLKISYNLRLLLAMLSFFVATIGGSTAVLSKMTMKKLGPVEIRDQLIVTPYGEVSFAELDDAYLHNEQERSLLDPNKITGSIRFLVIKEKSGKTHLLSEENYPIDQIFQQLKHNVSEWKKNDQRD